MARNRAIAVVLVLVLVLGAASLAVGLLLDGGDGGAGEPEERAIRTYEPQQGSDEAPEPGLAPYYSQELAWEACESNDAHDCATMTVPLDYADPGGETIEIAVLRVPAEDVEQRVGSLVVNPGGPGAPGTQYAAVSDLAFREPLTAAYDVVGFDPRGTGASAPVDCVSDAELDEFFAADPAPDTAAERAESEEQVAALGEGCAERSGDVAAHVSTEEAARDMDVLRAVLGETELTYLGASYGTKLGATYADLFADRAGRLVLDGGLDLSLGSRDLSLGQAGGFEVALRAYVSDCVEGGDCYLGDDLESGLATVEQFLDDVDGQPLPAGERELTVGLAFYGLVTPLYAEEAWPVLDLALGAALEDGDGSRLLALADQYVSRESDGSYADNSAEAIYAINCLDDPYALPAADVPDDLADFEEASPTFGDVFAYGQVGCVGFPGAGPDVAEPDGGTLGEGAAPIVVVGTTRDSATPYEWSQALADQLDSGVLLTRDGDGHTGYNKGNACVDEAVEAYLIDGEVPEDGTRC